MKYPRLTPVVCGIAAALLRSSLLFAQPEVDFTALGTGSFTLETASVQNGSLVSLETNLQDVAAIVVEDTGAGKELVRLETTRSRTDLQVKRLGKPEAEVIIDADSISGHFDHRIAYDLAKTKTIKVILTLNNGLEFPFTIYSQSSLTNRRITQTFSSKACQTITLTCSGGCSTSKICCTVAFCADCITCTITCGAGGCGGGGGGGCFSAGSQDQQTIAIPLERNREEPSFAKSSFVLHRTELGTDGLSYLVEEWVILTYSSQTGASGPRVSILNASSPEFAAAKSRDLTQGARVSWKGISSRREGSSETVLVIEAPIHPNNSRLVATPDLRLSDPEVPAGITPAGVLVRADFSEDETLQRLQVLRADGVVTDNLLAVLKDRLQLHRNSTRHHRTVVFARIEIDKSMEVSSLATILPKCCCNGAHCI